MAHAHGHQDGHDQDHARHDHGGHCHVHAPASFGKAFAFGIALNAGFVVLEVVYGLLSNSVALLADAGHNISDVLGPWRCLVCGSASQVGANYGRGSPRSLRRRSMQPSCW